MSPVAVYRAPHQWTPGRAGAVFWFSAQRGTFAYISGKISQWYNLGSAGVNATQASASSRPTLDATGINGRPAVLFDGSDDFLDLDTTTLDYAATNVFTVAHVTKLSATSPTTDNPVIASCVNNTDGWKSIWTRTGAAQAHYLTLFAASAQFANAQSPNSYPVATPIAVVDVWGGDPGGSLTSIRTFAGGSETPYANHQNDAAGGAMNQGRNGRIGALHNALPSTFGGHIGEVMVFPRLLSNDERRALDLYLSREWAVPTSA